MASVISFSPTSAAAGTIVNIVGTGYTNAGVVKLGADGSGHGGFSCVFTVVDDNHINATVPTICASGDVAVYGTTGLGAAPGFTFIAPPTPSSPSGTAVQDGINGGQILYTDTGSYGTIVSRTLNVFNYLGDVIGTFNMGTNLTQVYTYTADAWFQFQCVVVDNAGTWTNNVYFVSQGFYWDAYTAQFNATGCGCIGNNCNLEWSQLALNAALRFNLVGLAGAASSNTCIIAANFFVNQSTTTQLG